jgi:hypothetical protein
MKAYLKFAASFWMRAFLTIGSMTTAQSRARARARARTKKGSGASAAPVPL